MSLTPSDILQRIRFDPGQKIGSVYDVVQLVMRCHSGVASRNWTSILKSYPEVSQKVILFKFPGQGQRLTPCAPTSTLVEIAWLCPGRAAKEFRRQGAVTLCRALGGDLSLIDEIRERHGLVNAQEQEMLLAGTGVTAAEANGQAIEDPEERRQRLRRMSADTKAIEVSTQKTALNVFEHLRVLEAEAAEERDKMYFKDAAFNYIQNIFPSTRAIEGTQNAPLTISTVAMEMGIRLSREQNKIAGMSASRLYREQHGTAPPKHSQFVDGAVRKVNTYTEADRDIVETAIGIAIEQ